MSRAVFEVVQAALHIAIRSCRTANREHVITVSIRPSGREDTVNAATAASAVAQGDATSAAAASVRGYTICVTDTGPGVELDQPAAINELLERLPPNLIRTCTADQTVRVLTITETSRIRCSAEFVLVTAQKSAAAKKPVTESKWLTRELTKTAALTSGSGLKLSFEVCADLEGSIPHLHSYFDALFMLNTPNVQFKFEAAPSDGKPIKYESHPPAGRDSGAIIAALYDGVMRKFEIPDDVADSVMAAANCEVVSSIGNDASDEHSPPQVTAASINRTTSEMPLKRRKLSQADVQTDRKERSPSQQLVAAPKVVVHCIVAVAVRDAIEPKPSAAAATFAEATPTPNENKSAPHPHERLDEKHSVQQVATSNHQPQASAPPLSLPSTVSSAVPKPPPDIPISVTTFEDGCVVYPPNLDAGNNPTVESPVIVALRTLRKLWDELGLTLLTKQRTAKVATNPLPLLASNELRAKSSIATANPSGRQILELVIVIHLQNENHTPPKPNVPASTAGTTPLAARTHSLPVKAKPNAEAAPPNSESECKRPAYLDAIAPIPVSPSMIETAPVAAELTKSERRAIAQAVTAALTQLKAKQPDVFVSKGVLQMDDFTYKTSLCQIVRLSPDEAFRKAALEIIGVDSIDAATEAVIDQLRRIAVGPTLDADAVPDDASVAADEPETDASGDGGDIEPDSAADDEFDPDFDIDDGTPLTAASASIECASQPY